MRRVFRGGADHHDAKLDDDLVRAIRAAKVERDRLLAEAAELSATSLGRKMDVHEDTIRKIWRCEIWSHVE